MKSVAILLAPGFEEVEAITPIDFLRRAGVQVVTVGVESSRVRGSRGVILQADVLMDEIPHTVDGVILPGGMPGAANLSKNNKVLSTLYQYQKDHKMIAAICAAPAVVLKKMDIFKNTQYTCYPGFEKDAGGAFIDQDVVVDENVITSRGPGTAAAFSEKIIEYLSGVEDAELVHQTTLQMW